MLMRSTHARNIEDKSNAHKRQQVLITTDKVFSWRRNDIGITITSRLICLKLIIIIIINLLSRVWDNIEMRCHYCHACLL